MPTANALRRTNSRARSTERQLHFFLKFAAHQLWTSAPFAKRLKDCLHVTGNGVTNASKGGGADFAPPVRYRPGPGNREAVHCISTDAVRRSQGDPPPTKVTRLLLAIGQPGETLEQVLLPRLTERQAVDGQLGRIEMKKRVIDNSHLGPQEGPRFARVCPTHPPGHPKRLDLLSPAFYPRFQGQTGRLAYPDFPE